MANQYVGQLSGTGNTFSTANAAIPQPPASTLTRAISSVGDLNKRLIDLCQRAEQLAITIGGPFPVQGSDGEQPPKPNGAMQTLNDEIDAAHKRIGSLSSAIDAMSRALGQ